MADTPSPLETEIRRIIAVAGPMAVAEYMRLCLTHPQYGYYMTHDPLGSGGDFITAPEISQMFGELIGLWVASVWRQMGSPENVRLVELGPGRGTLMLDALRAAKVIPGFRDAVVLHLVEISPVLERAQEQRLGDLEIPILWHDALEQVPAGPVIVIANEFIDALPVHQAVKEADGWHERVVEIDSGGNFAFGVARDPLPHFASTVPRKLRDAHEGAIYEWRYDKIAFELGRRVRADGAALILDYGHMQSNMGDTLQAVAGHAFTNPLVAPGEVDLTAHVDFEALASGAESLGARIQGPISQRDFLLRLGIDKRAAALKGSAPREKAVEIDVALSRLIAGGKRGMGELFKALAIADPKLGALPGFEE
jgi:NADH dehydrogenase [ubiquinone] 1 alpha subcomplex assembly factor 7